MRERDRQFAEFFLDELRVKEPRAAMIGAGRRLGWSYRGVKVKGESVSAWRKPYTDKQIVGRAKKILARESVVEYCKYLFEAVGFSPVDATKKLVEHITTPTEKNPLGSLEALKAYHKLTLEEQTHKVQVDTRMLVAHKMVGEKPPATRVRALKAADVELPG